jgi:uncharacterized membrane protein
MIQRIQSVWLLLAALSCAGLFFFNLYTAQQMVNGTQTLVPMRVNGGNEFLLMLLAIAIIVIPLFAIFRYKNRKQQKSIVVLNMVAVISFIAVLLMHIANYNHQTPAPLNGAYGIASVLPVFALVFLGLALRGINKDDKLVKSVDRLR